MRKIMVLLLGIVTLFVSIQAQADRRVYGRGQDSSYCQPGWSNFCFNDTKRQSEAQARQDMEYQCRAAKGQIVGWSVYCRTNCNPAFWNPNEDRAIWVRCWSDCDATCEIKPNPEE